MCFQETELSFLLHPIVTKNKLNKYENDNDYASDEEQVEDNQKTILKALTTSLRSFAKGESASKVINIECAFVAGQIPKGVD